MSANGISERLLPGERIQWSGQPQQGLMLVPQDAYLIPFSLLWGGFAIFWETSVLSIGNAPGFFALWGIPFVLAGLYMIVGRFFVDAWLRSRTYYGLTDRRALILRGDKFVTVDLQRLEVVELKGGPGRGTIQLGRSEPMLNAWRGGGWGIWMPSLSGTPQFLKIDNVQSVFNQIEQIRARKP